MTRGAGRLPLQTVTVSNADDVPPQHVLKQLGEGGAGGCDDEPAAVPLGCVKNRAAVVVLMWLGGRGTYRPGAKFGQE
jgi:hypothetical protein